jgi:thiamine biosynthesis lipoprotein ApbE
MNDIDGLDGETPEDKSLKTQLREEMAQISEDMSNMQDETDPNSLISKLNTMEQNFLDAMELLENSQTLLATLNKEIYGDLNTSYTGLYQRVYNLEN